MAQHIHKRKVHIYLLYKKERKLQLGLLLSWVDHKGENALNSLHRVVLIPGRTHLVGLHTKVRLLIPSALDQ